MITVRCYNCDAETFMTDEEWYKITEREINPEFCREGCEGCDPGAITEGAVRTIYAVVYETQRCYGGSEEGGWWYDAGVPLSAVPMKFKYEQVEGEPPGCLELKVNADWVKQENEKVCVALGLKPTDEDVKCSWVESWPVPFPSRKPHYE